MKAAKLFLVLFIVFYTLFAQPFTGDTLFVDIDGDGDLDRLISGSDGSRFYLKNLGDGRYIDVIVQPASVSQAPAFYPANPDSQYFMDETEARLPDNSQLSSASAVGDVDGDGDLDILVGNGPFGSGWSGQNKLLINNGNGYFTDETADRLPPDNEETEGIALGDFDRDGDTDIVFANPAEGGGQNLILINNGEGYFTDETDGRFPDLPNQTREIAVADINNDQYLDLLFVNVLGWESQVYINDGSGFFSDATEDLFPPGSDTLSNFDFLPVDVDGDFDLDLVLINFLGENAERQDEILWLNNGDGYYVQVDGIFPQNPDDAGLGGDAFDFNGDYSGDILVARVFQNALYFSDDYGSFTDETDLRLPTNDRTAALMIGDVNGDGYADIFCANSTYDDQLFLNNSENVFIDVTSEYLPSITSSSSRSVELADFDGDGDLDIFTASTGDGQNRLLINHGNVQDTIPPVIYYDYANSIDGNQQIRIFVQDNMRWMDRVGIWTRTIEDTAIRYFQ